MDMFIVIKLDSAYNPVSNGGDMHWLNDARQTSDFVICETESGKVELYGPRTEDIAPWNGTYPSIEDAFKSAIALKH